MSIHTTMPPSPRSEPTNALSNSEFPVMLGEFPVSIGGDAAESVLQGGRSDVDKLVVCCAEGPNGGGHVDICFDGPGGFGDILGQLSPDEAQRLGMALLLAAARIEAQR